MAYVTVTHWTATEMNDEMMAIAQEKFVPMVMAVGADSVQMVRTGDLSLCVVTQYADAGSAASAKQKIDEIRSQAANEFPMKMDSAHGGEVFAAA
ncbi:MAG: hypothetical protein GY947_23595 [Rhodobacteraceae bacterium]|nr:hypothetical protein [Paracoccaceae bacterium]